MRLRNVSSAQCFAIAIGAHHLARLRHKLGILLQAFATVGRPERDGKLHALVAEFQMLLDVIAGAVGRNVGFGLSAKKLVDTHLQCVANEIPESQIDAADGVDRDAVAAIGHAGAPQRVPKPLDVEWVLADEELREMLRHDFAATRAAGAITLHALIRGYLDRESTELARIRIP
jgi:hypothetical protein